MAQWSQVSVGMWDPNTEINVCLAAPQLTQTPLSLRTDKGMKEKICTHKSRRLAEKVPPADKDPPCTAQAHRLRSRGESPSAERNIHQRRAGKEASLAMPV